MIPSSRFLVWATSLLAVLFVVLGGSGCRARPPLGEIHAVEAIMAPVSPEKKEATKKDLLLISDLPPEHLTIVNLHALYPGRIISVHPDPTEVKRNFTQGVNAFIVLLSNTRALDSQISARLKQFGADGGRVFMDLNAYGIWRGVKVERAKRPGAEGATHASPLESMGTGIRVLKEMNVTRGFRPGQVVPWFGDDGGHFTLAALDLPTEIETLGVSTLNGLPAFVQERVGKGIVAAVDMLSLSEPIYTNVGSFSKYLFLGNLIGQSVRYGEYFPKKLSYHDFVELLKQTCQRNPGITLIEEGKASDGQSIFSLNLGDPHKPLFLFIAMLHGTEWEPGYGLITFARFMAVNGHAGQLDFNKYSLKIIPCLNPFGYEAYKRLNANGVNLNLNGSSFWKEFTGSGSNRDGTKAPGQPYWKGESPFSEPETKIFKKICDEHTIHCLVDFHGNANARYNKMVVLPVTGTKNNLNNARMATQYLNAALKDRYIFKQNAENVFSQYLFKEPLFGGRAPFLINYAASGRYGFLIETTAGYPGSYATVMQTDVVVETCLATLRFYGVK
jgi:hypothetical protein